LAHYHDLVTPRSDDPLTLRTTRHRDLVPSKVSREIIEASTKWVAVVRTGRRIEWRRIEWRRIEWRRIEGAWIEGAWIERRRPV